MTDPLLSVTVTNYNYARFLDEAIQSILGQTFTDFELILIDNASDDDSVEIMRRYASSDPRVRVVEHEQNLGMFASLDESCTLSRGRYRVPVEADDWVIAPDAFAVQVDMLERHPSVVFVYSSLTMIGPNDRVFHVSRPYQGDVVLPGVLALEEILAFALTHTGMMMRVDALRATRGYQSKYPHISDMALAVDLCALGDVGYIDRSLYGFRQHETNLHLEPQLHTVRDQIVPLLDEAFAGSAGARVRDAPGVRKRLLQRALLHLPTQYIFSGHPGTGWRLYWESVKVRPLATIAQPTTLALVARTLVGYRGYVWLRRLLRRPHGSQG